MCCVFNCAYAGAAATTTAITHARPALQDPEIRRTEPSFLRAGKGPAGRTRATSSPAIGVRNDSLPCNELQGSIGGAPCDSPRESATSRGMGEARGGGANGVHNEGTKRTEANEEES